MHNNVCHKVKPEQHEEYYKLKLPLPLPSWESHFMKARQIRYAKKRFN
jgi:hypothetical protein